MRDDDLKRKITVNGQTVWLDELSFKKGAFKVARETMSEQCSDCGVDIAESGILEKGAGVVRCSRKYGGCGTFYRIAQVKD